MKECNVCKLIKDNLFFNKRKLRSGEYSLVSSCKSCIKIRDSIKYKNESDEARNLRKSNMKKWQSNNHGSVLRLKKDYRIRKKIIKLCSIKHDQHVVMYYKFINNISSLKYESHVHEWRSNKRIYNAWKQKHDMSYVVYQRLKRGVQRALKNNDRSDWMEILGYTSKDLMLHIESQFTFGMFWDNRHEWHIDHIKPLCAFNIINVNSQEFKECFALDNLQPLWRHHNVIKYHTHDKYLSVR